MGRIPLFYDDAPIPKEDKMTKHNENYTVTLTEKPGVPAIVQMTVVEDDIRDLAFVGCEKATLAQDAVPASGSPLTLSLTCNEAFAAEVANTAGVAAVQKQIVKAPSFGL